MAEGGLARPANAAAAPSGALKPCKFRISAGGSFVGETHHYQRFNTDKGMFEIVYGGAMGAMQGFGGRLTQDQILRVMAFVRSLKK